MSVRAKFQVKRIEIQDMNGEESKTIVLNPVFKSGDPDSENSKFFRWTPSGEIRLMCLNPEASAQFEISKEYYVDFTKCEE